jgi:hypothetical protein
MISFKQIFDFIKQYSCGFVRMYALVRMTHFMFHNYLSSYLNFAFGTIVGYNFVKYDALARIKKQKCVTTKLILC